MPILLLETLHADAEALLAQHDHVVLAVNDAHVLDVARQGGVTGILTRGKGKITRELMSVCGSSLKAVSRVGAGLDTVDTVAAKDFGVKVIYAPGGNAATTAEHALMLMMAAGRELARLNANVKAGNWDIRSGYQGIELNGKTLGVVGLGNIGMRVAELGKAFGMRVVYWSRSGKDDRFQFLPLEQLLCEADFISLHVALSNETKGMLGAKELALMKPTAILVNTARGALIDQAALATALNEGKLAAFAADVLAQQPPDPNDPLLKSDRVTLTPHVAGLTDRTYREVCVYCAKNVLAVVRGEMPDERSVFC